MKPTPTSPRYKPPIAAIKLGMSGRSAIETRFGRLLVGFMRLVSLFCVLQGLYHWMTVLTADSDGTGALETMTSFGLGAVVFFCVIDLIAAVGLWLAAAWGGVVWLVAVAAQWLVVLTLPGFFHHDVAIGVADLILVAAYLFLTYQAAREHAPVA